MKKIFSIFLASLMAASLVACTPSPDAPATTEANVPDGAMKKVSLKVWASQDDQELTQKMVDAFKAKHPEKEWDITLAVVGAPDAKTKYLEDPSAAADVFTFANDQLADLVNTGALYEVTRNAEDVKTRNSKGSVGAATREGKLYAYPLTADNGYFMYYDKSVLSEEDVLSLDAMLEKAKAAGKKVFMDVSNGWYIASFFLSNGGKFEVVDGKQKVNFNNENGVIAGEAIKAFTAHEAFLTGDDAILNAGFQEKTLAAGVSGTWNAESIKKALGDNYAAAKLPSFTTPNGLVQMSSFAGYKLVGVNSQTAFPEEAMDLADFLTSEENQALAFAEKGYGPSNLKVAESDAVKSNVALAALASQSSYAVSQNDVLGGYWAPAEAFGTVMEAKDYSKSVKELLDEMVAQIEAGQ